jgi:hypothetical protein
LRKTQKVVSSKSELKRESPEVECESEEHTVSEKRQKSNNPDSQRMPPLRVGPFDEFNDFKVHDLLVFKSQADGKPWFGLLQSHNLSKISVAWVDLVEHEKPLGKWVVLTVEASAKKKGRLSTLYVDTMPVEAVVAIVGGFHLDYRSGLVSGSLHERAWREIKKEIATYCSGRPQPDISSSSSENLVLTSACADDYLDRKHVAPATQPKVPIRGRKRKALCRADRKCKAPPPSPTTHRNPSLVDRAPNDLVAVHGQDNTVWVGLYIRAARGDKVVLNWAEPTDKNDATGGYTLLVAESTREPLITAIPKSSVIYNWGDLLQFNKKTYLLTGSIGQCNWDQAQASMALSMKEAYESE